MGLRTAQSLPRIRPRSLGTLALVCLPFACLFFVDGIAIETIARDDFTSWRDFGSSLTEVANAAYWIPLAALLSAGLSLLVRLRRGKPDCEAFRNLRQWALHLLLALLGSGAVLQVLKIFAGRERPSFARSAAHAMNFGLLRFGYLYSSFPSGHSQVIFCVATLLGMLLPRARVPAYTAALVIALTRVVVLKHFPSDVVVGMLLGVYGSRWSVQLWSRRIPAPLPWFAARPATRLEFPAAPEEERRKAA